jgi:hypothetical protein
MHTSERSVGGILVQSQNMDLRGVLLEGLIRWVPRVPMFDKMFGGQPSIHDI